MKPLKQAVYSSRTADKFVVRFPDGLRERIAKVSESQHRSMNSQIVNWLEACTDLAENSQTDIKIEELAAMFANENSRDSLIVPAVAYKAPLPAPGVPVTVDLKEKPYEGMWLVRDYNVTGSTVTATLVKPTLANPSSSISVRADKLVPV